MLIDMCLPKFNIYEGTVTPNCFKSQTLNVMIFFKKNKFCLMSSLKFTLSDVTLLLPENLPGLKKIYSGL